MEADGPVRIITMNNPDMRNAFIDPLHEAMRNIWYQISRDRDARAVVLTGAGSAFCAGGNVPGFIRDYDDPEHRRQSLRDAQRLVDEMLRFHLPVVAAVNGPAVGLGASVAVTCDIVLIAESTYIADTHVNIGLTAGDGGAATWPLLIGMLRAKEYLLTGERIPAALAVEFGLANRVVADDQLMPEATRARAQAVGAAAAIAPGDQARAQCPPPAGGSVRASVRALRRGRVVRHARDQGDDREVLEAVDRGARHPTWPPARTSSSCRARSGARPRRWGRGRCARRA